MSAALALQKAIRGRLTGDPAVTALVPAANIFDRHARPTAFPCIILGEDQEVAADEVARRHFRVYATLHLWQKEPGLTGVKAIAGAVRRALRDGPWPLDQHYCHDLAFSGARFLRDPKSETVSHSVVTIEALIEELP